MLKRHRLPGAVRALSLLLLCTAAQAQHRLSPGLWETEMQMGSGGPEAQAAMERMQRAMAAMSPEQRAQMEAMMAQRGIGMGGAGGAPGTVRTCVSAEQAARDEMTPQQGACRQTRRSREGNTVRFAFECSGARAGQGEGEFTLVGPHEHQGRLRMSTTRGNGQPMTMEMTMRSRWLGADCGDIKPRP